MRFIDLKTYERMVIPRNQAELMRALTPMIQNLGAKRFGYLQVPTCFELINQGVIPKILTNFPEHITRDYFRNAITPLHLAHQVMANRIPAFISDSDKPDDVYFNGLLREANLCDGIIFPIQGTDNAVFIYFFECSVDRSWLDIHRNGPMAQIAEMTHIVITARPEMAKDFEIPGWTPRAKQVMKNKARGLTNEQIAVELGVKPDTIKKAIRRLSDRLGGLSTAELIYHLTKMGML